MSKFGHLLTETVSVASEVGPRSAHGDPTYGPVRVLKAAVGHSQQRVLSTDGEVRISAHRVDTAVEIKATDRIWIGDEDPAVDPGHVPMTVVNESDRRGGVRLFVTYL